MSDAGESGVKSLGIFSALQSATEAKFFLSATAFILLIDNVFIHLAEPSLFALARSLELTAAANLGLKVILIFVLFSFITLMLRLSFPICNLLYIEISAVVENFFSSLVHTILREKSYRNQPWRRVHYKVLPEELHKEAHLTKDSYLLARDDEYRKRAIQIRDASSQRAFFSFYCFIMLTWNWWIGTDENRALSVVFFGHFGHPSFVFLALIVLLFLTFRRYHGFDDPPEWVYCPSLYAELEKRDLLEREKQKKFEDEIAAEVRANKLRQDNSYS